MMSTLPQASIAVATSSSAALSLVRSPAKTAVSPAISPAVCSATSPSRSLMSTFAPCSESSSAVARPMPRAEPVTIATLSSRTPMSFSLVSSRSRECAWRGYIWPPSPDPRRAMRLYPDVPARRNATIAGDLGVLLAVALLAAAGLKVHHDVSELASLSRGVQSAGSAVQGGFDAAAGAFGATPIVGTALGEALREAGERSGGEAVRAAREGEQDVNRLADLLGWLIFLVPTGLLLARHVPRRVADVRRL